MDAFITRKRPRIAERSQSTGDTRDASISPPPKRKTQKGQVPDGPVIIDLTGDDDEQDLKILADTHKNDPIIESKASCSRESVCNSIPSPIQLNHVDGLPASSNIDTVKLSDILGGPMIKECWLFNYLFDIDFVMQQFDPDIRDLVKIKIVHGSWKAEDSNGIGIIEGSRRFPNIQVVKAYMAEAFGTHHSKMIVLFRHDDTAQVIILTANFIERDWSMSQAIWRTPPLSFLHSEVPSSPSLYPIGSGPKFKQDLLAYVRGYGQSKLQALITQLQQYDFSTVRGALIASVPGRQHPQSVDPDNTTLWGWPGLKNILRRIPFAPSSETPSHPQIIIQVSSVASVGETWLKSTFFPTLTTTPSCSLPRLSTPKISLIFPTADSIHRSVTGYSSGASIHMKISSTPQAKQLAFLHPLLHHWSPPPNHSPPSAMTTATSKATAPTRAAGRHRAAPHIKTYIRFTTPQMESIDWAMLTSANLSTQAWGSSAAAMGEVRICSFEIGVVVWPSLFAEREGERVVMVPTFKRETLAPVAREESKGEREQRLVAWRMPYDLPLLPYAKNERPWCASEADGEKDWMGRVWPGYEK